MYLLDTNILSEIIRHPYGDCASRAAAVDPSDLLTSVIVACELRYGIAPQGSPALSVRVEGALGQVTVVPLGEEASVIYGRLRADLERRGQPIGAYDMLIAAHALALGATLVTDNVREFERVEELAVENWLRTG